MNAAKIGILAVVLGAPFGLAVYDDFVARPAAGARQGVDELQDQVNEMRDQVAVARTEAAERQRAAVAQDQLVERLGDRPRVATASELTGIDGVSVTDGLMVNGKGKYDAGVFLELPDPDSTLRGRLTARWGDPIERADTFDQERWFWFDREHAVRVMLVEGGLDERSALELRPYTPLVPLVREAIGYLGKPTSSLPVTDSSSAPIEMVRPPSEYSDAATRVQFWPAHGKVVRVIIFADILYDPEFASELNEPLSEGRGQPTAGPIGGGGTRYDFPGSPPVRVNVAGDGDTMTIEAGDQEPTRP